jgi:hypothetical protein
LGCSDVGLVRFPDSACEPRSVALNNNETSDPCDWLARHIVIDSNSEAETESVTFEVLSAFWLLWPEQRLSLPLRAIDQAKCSASSACIRGFNWRMHRGA